MRGLSRYAAVGAVATAAHYLLLVALVEWAGLAPGPAAWWGAVLGALVAYAGNRRYTFAQQATSHGRALPRFAFIALLGSLANALIVGGGSALGMHYLLMQVLATALVMLGTFHLNRVWTFDARG
jgi:putative flippase GtrA